ncbi:MAG: hypothetical protein ACREUQ_05520 [Burkholderiales bacterium]
MRLARIIVLGLSVASVVSAAAAQQLRDPTRPPTYISPSTTGEAPDQKDADQKSDLVLQTVLISPERRNVVINGKLLALGQSISGQKVIAIYESEVLLSGSDGALKLRLFPAVDKRRPRVAESGRGGNPRPAPTKPKSDRDGQES